MALFGRLDRSPGPEGGAPPAPRGWHLALLVLAPVLAYANSLDVPFALDDDTSIVVNPAITRWGADTGARPLAYFTFRLNYLLGGLNPFGYHVVNVALHVLAALAVFGLARRLLRLGTPGGTGDGTAEAAALAGALAFALHPVQTQAVTYVVQRMASLATLFYVVALLLYVVGRTSASKGVRTGAFAGALAAAAAAVLSKEIAFTLPFAVLLVELAFLTRPRLHGLARAVPFLLLFAWVPIALSGPIRRVLTSTTAAGSGATRLEYAATQTRVVLGYLRLVAWPSGLNLDHDVPLETGFGAPAVLASLLVLLLLVGALALLLSRARPHGLRLVGAGGLLFFLGLSVESTIVPIADLMVEHRLYLPMAGAALAVAGALQAAASAWPDRRRALAAAAGTWLLALGVATAARNHVWRDGVSLWSDVVAKSPLKPRAHYNLGEALLARGDLEGATREWARTLELDPQHSFASNQLGSLAWTGGDLATAERWYRRAVVGRPTNPEAQYNLALLLESTGRAGEAADLYRRFVATAPPHLRAEADRVRRRFGWR